MSAIATGFCRPVGIPCLAALALSACSPEASDEIAAPDVIPEPTESLTPESTTDAALPPDDETFRFAGRWAETVEMCREEPWTITGERLTAPGGAACGFTRMEESPGGYMIDARCTVDGETQDDRIVLRFAESAQALLVEGATTLPETGLIQCSEERG
jgi:hypothetical protein